MRKIGFILFLAGLFWVRAAGAQSVAPVHAAQTDATTAPPAAEPMDDRSIDAYALQTPPEVTRTVQSLADYFCRKLTTDRAKARAIFTWMTANLAYDLDNYETPNPHYEDRPEVVLNSPFRCTACGGNSRMFASLAWAAGLKAVVIHGYIRKMQGKTGRIVHTEAGHAYEAHFWNAVQIAGAWKLVDTTVANPRRKMGDKIQTEGATDYDYFLIPAEYFKYTHLPDAPRWQLLEKPLSRTEQENLPFLAPTFFKQGGSLISHSELTVRGKSDVCVTIGLDKSAFATGRLFQDDREIKGAWTFSQRGKNGFDITARVPQAGTYQLRLYAAKIGSTDALLPFVATYLVTMEQGSESACPIQGPLFWSREISLESPLHGLLDSATPQDFKVTAPGATRVVVKSGAEFIPLEKQGDVYTGRVSVAPGEVLLEAEYPDKPNFFRGLVKYQAR